MAEDKALSRRDFLKLSGAATAHAALTLTGVAAVAESFQVQPESIAQRVENMPLSELEALVYEKTPVVPDIAEISERLQGIARIEPGGKLMKAGSSVAQGMLKSAFGEDAEVNLGREQGVFDEVQRYFHFPEGAIEAASVVGSDMDTLLYESMYCRGPMPCPPNTSVIDAYIDYYHPWVSINFVGSNLVRRDVPFEVFEGFVETYINHFVHKGVIPIMTTFPHPRSSEHEPYNTWFNDPQPIGGRGMTKEEEATEQIEYRSSMLPENALKYNAILIEVAKKYQVPIINLQRGVVESAANNGTWLAMPPRMPEIDPEHFSHSIGEARSTLTLPPTGGRFENGEQAVSYFTLLTLSELIRAQASVVD